MKILMVCLGNICRSPMAEGLLQEKIKKYGLNAQVDSCGFEAYHLGEIPDKRAIQVMQKHGIDISGQRQRLFSADDFTRFDKIYVMDAYNYQCVKKKAHSKEDLRNVDYILNEINPYSDDEVPDPYLGGESGFEHVYQLLDQATEAICSKLKKGNF